MHQHQALQVCMLLTKVSPFSSPTCTGPNRPHTLRHDQQQHQPATPPRELTKLTEVGGTWLTLTSEVLGPDVPLRSSSNPFYFDNENYLIIPASGGCYPT